MGKYEKFSAYTVTALSTSGIQEVQDQREKKNKHTDKKKKRKWKSHGPQILRLQYVESKIIQLLKYMSWDYWVPG